MSQNNDNKGPTTVSVSEGAATPAAEPPKKEENPNQEAAPKKLVPSKEDLPPNAEPAMEQAPSAPLAGESQLAEDVAPKPGEGAKEPGVDEMLEEVLKNKKADEDDDLKDIDLETNQVIVGNKETIVDDLVNRYPTRAAFDAARKDEKSLVSLCYSASNHGWGTTSGGDIRQVLQIDDMYKHLVSQQDRMKFPGIQDGHPSRITHKSVDVSGKEAILAIKARLGGIVRVNLLNSGFWVALRSPQLNELQEIFATIDFDNKEIGRILGGHFALITDMYLKRKFVEILVNKRLIVESNFADIFKAGAFVRNLAYHDYETLLHGIVTLMTRGGMRYRCICPSCGMVSVETLDMSACKFINEDLWTPEVAAWWNNVVGPDGKPLRRTENDLATYREQILGRKETYSQEFDNGLGDKVKIDLVIKEPTMARFFEIGDKLIKNLNETIDAVSDGDSDKAEMIKASISIHQYQLIAPWIEELVLWRDEKNVEIKTTDSTAILEHLDQSIQQDSKLFDALTKYIKDSRFVWIGTQSIRCPQCGAKPTTAMDSFYPLEIQTIFFGLLSRLWLAAR